MALTRAQEIRVGVIATLAIVIVVFGIVWGKGLGFGVDNRSIRLSFESAAGVDLGTPIMLRGVRVGAVTGIDVQPDRVVVSASMRDVVRLKRDAVGRLGMLEVTGGKKIEIDPGVSGKVLGPEDMIRGVTEGDITAILGVVGKISVQADRLIGRIDTTVAIINDILGSRDFKGDIGRIFAQLDDATSATRNLVVGNREAVNAAVGNLRNVSEQLRDLVNHTRPALERTVVAADGATADARVLLARIDTTMRRTDLLVAHIDSITVEVIRGKGAVSKLIYDPAFAAQLDSTVVLVQRLLDDITRNGVKTNIKIGF